MPFDLAGIGEKVVVGVVSAAALGALALFGNWASQGGLVHALGGVTAEELKSQIKALEVDQFRDQLASIKSSMASIGTNAAERANEEIKKLNLPELQDQIGALRLAQDQIEVELKTVSVQTAQPAPPAPKPKILVKEIMVSPQPPATDKLELSLRDAIKKKCDGEPSCDFDPWTTDVAIKFPALDKIGVTYLCSNKTGTSSDGGARFSVLVLRCDW